MIHGEQLDQLGNEILPPIYKYEADVIRAVSETMLKAVFLDEFSREYKRLLKSLWKTLDELQRKHTTLIVDEAERVVRKATRLSLEQEGFSFEHTDKRMKSVIDKAAADVRYSTKQSLENPSFNGIPIKKAVEITLHEIRNEVKAAGKKADPKKILGDKLGPLVRNGIGIID